MRASESSGKWLSPPVAMIATFHGPSPTTRAMWRPASKQRRAVGCGVTKQFTQNGTSGGTGRSPYKVETGLRNAWSSGADHDAA